jgi:Short C-terminal domain
MDKYAEIEKLADLVQKGLLTESEYQVEKQKLLNGKNGNQSSDTSASITVCELKRIKDYDDNFLIAKQLKANGHYSGIYLAVAFCSLLFGSPFFLNMRDLSYLVSLPAIFVLPIYLMRIKKMKAAHAESKVIFSKLSAIELEINLLRKKNNLNDLPPEIPFLHGSPKQQWLVVILYYLLIASVTFLIGAKDHPIASAIGVSIGLLIAVPLSLFGAIICNALSRILVSFTEIRTWLLVGVLYSSISILCGPLFWIFGLAHYKKDGEELQDVMARFQELTSTNVLAFWLICALAVMFVLLMISGRLVWRKTFSNVFKAISLPYAVSVIVYTGLFVFFIVMKNKVGL